MESMQVKRIRVHNLDCVAAGTAKALNLCQFYAELVSEGKVHIFEQTNVEIQKDVKAAFVGGDILKAKSIMKYSLR
jgi:hypothetical protein